MTYEPSLPLGNEVRVVLFLLKSTPFSEVYLLFSRLTFIDVRLLQSKKEFSIEVTELGIVTLVKLLHPRKADSPMLVTLSGIVTFVRLVHS